MLKRQGWGEGGDHERAEEEGGPLLGNMKMHTFLKEALEQSFDAEHFAW